MNADELNAVTKNLGVAAADIHLGEDASETTLKRAALADYDIVYFATHGFVAGDVKGLAEPSLVLSIPRQPTEFDDGLLTSSEVAQLKLNADWVVLSACNTIAGDRPGAEGAVRARAGASGLALGGRFGGRHPACDIDLRPAEGRPEDGPRQGAASGHAGLSQRRLVAPQRRSGVLGAVCADWRGCRSLIILMLQRSNREAGP
jgi:hypothetical protein